VKFYGAFKLYHKFNQLTATLCIAVERPVHKLYYAGLGTYKLDYLRLDGFKVKIAHGIHA